MIEVHSAHDSPADDPLGGVSSTSLRPCLDSRSQSGGQGARPSSRAPQLRRKLIERGFGWMKVVGGLWKVRHRGKAKVAALSTFARVASRRARPACFLLPATPPGNCAPLTRALSCIPLGVRVAEMLAARDD